MIKVTFLTGKEPKGGGWAQRVEYAGSEYSVVVTPGRMVRIAFKPRGKNRGYKYNVSVYRIKGKPSETVGEIFHEGDVGKGVGTAPAVEAALAHEFMTMAFGPRYAWGHWYTEYQWNDPRYAAGRKAYDVAKAAGHLEILV